MTRQGINNQQLAVTRQAEHSTEDSLRFDRALEALGESTNPTKDEVFARKMAAYGRPNNVASKFPTHLDSAPPPVAVKKGTEPDIHSAVGALPHEAAPLLDQMRQKGTPVKKSKLTGLPSHRNNSPRPLCMGRTTRVTETPHFYVQR